MTMPELPDPRVVRTSAEIVASQLVSYGAIGLDQRLNYPRDLGLVNRAVDELSSLGVGIVTGDSASFIGMINDYIPDAVRNEINRIYGEK